jgi:hypothetical protein
MVPLLAAYGVATHVTAIPLPLAIMDANIALSDLASCGTHRIRAKLVRRVHRLVGCFFQKHIMPMAVVIFQLLPPFHQLMALYPLLVEVATFPLFQ